MAIYTYEVDHGDDSPAINAGMEVNGGKVTAVQFDSALARLEKIEDSGNALIAALDSCGVDDSVIRIASELSALKTALEITKEPE